MIKSKTTDIGDNLEVYQQEVENELARILTFWKENALDFQHGGFIGQMDNKGMVNKDSPKGSVLNARILWTFSAAFRHTGDVDYRKIAQRAYHYLTNYFFDKEHGGVYWSVDVKGQPLNTRKQIYALAFAIYGFSEYYRVTQETQALKICRELFEWIETHSFDEKRGGYFEAYSREGQLLDDLRLSVKDRNDPKTMNTHLHVLEAYANLYRVWPDQGLARQLEALLTVFLEHILNSDTGHLYLFFNNDWTVMADMVSYGHDIEASWLLLEAAEVLGNEALIKKVKSVSIKMAKAVEEGLQQDGSLFHEWNRTNNHYDKHREWWVGAEAMVGFLNAYQLTNNTAFLSNSWSSWQFAKKHLLDKEKGGWFWGVHEDYSVMKDEDKIGFWKCPYHNSRACMEIVRRCGLL